MEHFAKIAVNYFDKTSHLRYLTRFWIRLCFAAMLLTFSKPAIDNLIQKGTVARVFYIEFCRALFFYRTRLNDCFWILERKSYLSLNVASKDHPNISSLVDCTFKNHCLFKKVLLSRFTSIKFSVLICQVHHRITCPFAYVTSFNVKSNSIKPINNINCLQLQFIITNYGFMICFI